MTRQGPAWHVAPASRWCARRPHLSAGVSPAGGSPPTPAFSLAVKQPSERQAHIRLGFFAGMVPVRMPTFPLSHAAPLLSAPGDPGGERRVRHVVRPWWRGLSLQVWAVSRVPRCPGGAPRPPLPSLTGLSGVHSPDSLGWKLFYVSGCLFVAVQNLEDWQVRPVGRAPGHSGCPAEGIKAGRQARGPRPLTQRHQRTGLQPTGPGPDVAGLQHP